MQTVLPVLIIGLIGGIAVGFQPPLASLMSQRLGIMESVFIVHLGGAIAAGIPLLMMSGGNLAAWRNVPWYALVAGIFGLVVLSAVSYTIPRLGVATTIILIVAGQMTIGMMLDHFGLLGAAVRPIDVSKVLGVAALFLGVWLMVR